MKGEKHTDSLKHLYIGLSMSILMFLVGFYGWSRFIHGGLIDSVIVGLLMAGAYWGWYELSLRFPKYKRVTENNILNIILLILYYGLKGLLSLCFGIFIGPYRVHRICTGIAAARKAKKSAKES